MARAIGVLTVLPVSRCQHWPMVGVAASVVTYLLYNTCAALCLLLLCCKAAHQHTLHKPMQ